MLELLQITNDPRLAERCDALGGIRVFVDLETHGKAVRQAGRDTFISAHALEDVARIRAVVRRSRLMVRVNPLHAGTQVEVDAVVRAGADELMLPMFRAASELREFAGIVAGRLPIVALLETRAALESLREWVGTPGLAEVFMGLNDLHLSLGQRFMFEPLADGTVEAVAPVVRAAGLRFGFGGIARLDGGLLPGRDVLAEHMRIGSDAVILSRSFHRPAPGRRSFEEEVAALRAEEARLRARTPQQALQDARRIAAAIRVIADALPAAP